MLEFEAEVIYTGKHERVSKKTDKPYTLVNFLGEDGNSFGVLLKEGVYLPAGLTQLDKVNVRFGLNVGRFMNLSILDIESSI